MSQSLAKDFNFRSLLKFAFPSIIMMIFMSLYSIVDGFFIAQYVDSMALSAANIVYPAVSILLAVGIMFGTGGSAVVAAKIGQGKQEEANRNFSALTLTTLIIGILGAVLGNLFCRQICSLLGATPVLMDYGTAYLRTILSFAPVCLLQALFQSFFVTAGRPGLGLSLTVSAGITNMLLDYLFVVPLHLGVAGAALATGLGQCIPAVAGILYFTFARKGLRFTRPEFSKGLLSTSCFNGSSEMVSNLSAAVVTYLFNMLMLKFEGEIGVAAITAILYGQFLFVALYLGYSIGVAPVFSFNYGAGNLDRVKKTFRLVFTCSLVFSTLSCLAIELFPGVFVAMFNDKPELVEIAVETAKCAKIFGIAPKVAFLSYSTKGSGKGEDVDKMRNACEKAKALMPDIPVDGEMQFDAAVSPTVGQLKFPGSPVAGYANTFIFPDINAGNIGYKIAQRLGGFEAYGPILLGLNAPINDLSRGCNAQEVYSMAIITAALAE